MTIHPLSWDSEFFGVPTCKVLATPANPDSLAQLLLQCKKDGYRWVQWFSSKTIDPAWLKPHNGLEADVRLTYAQSLQKRSVTDFSPNHVVQPYDLPQVNSDLLQLALQSGHQSRFSKDPHISKEQFDRLYSTWIIKSLHGPMADEVLIVGTSDHIQGMVTVRAKEGVGSIGLIAVQPNFHGQGVGTSLVHSALKWALSQGCNQANVVTQQQNQVACALYQSCDYTVQSTDYVYHFWL